MIKDDEHDFWTNLPGHLIGESAFKGDAALKFEIIENVEPLGDQFGLAKPLTVPPQLHETLFGQVHIIEGGASCLYTHTLCLMLLRFPACREILEASDLAHACLFQGEAAADLRDVAPWIIRLEEGNGLTRGLFSTGDGPQQLWDANPGIFLRSQETLDDIRKHYAEIYQAAGRRSKVVLCAVL